MDSPLYILLCFLALLASSLADPLSGIAATNRYWDCCKPSCGWKDKADFNRPVQTCNIDDQPLTDFSVGTGCNGGGAYTCSNQSPWSLNDTFAYGFAGAFLNHGNEKTWCCSCYQLQFLNSELQGKTMIVQASNTDYDTPGSNIFTFAIPGGNNSYSGCAAQYKVSNDVYGANVTGVASRSDCDALPEGQRKGCQFRFDWLKNVESPQVNFTRVACPAALTDITGCIRNDEKKLSTIQNSTSIATLGTSPGSAPSLAAISGLVLAFTWAFS